MPPAIDGASVKRRLRWDMPLRVPWSPPVWWLIMGVLMAVLVAMSPVADWRSGEWTPSLFDALYLVVGIAVGAACIIPDLLWYRWRGDDYVRRVHRLGLVFRSWSWALWYILFVMMPRYLLSVMPSRYDVLLIQVGACLGLVAWYTLHRAIWKRWQELRAEADERFRQLSA